MTTAMLWSGFRWWFFWNVALMWLVGGVFTHWPTHTHTHRQPGYKTWGSWEESWTLCTCPQMLPRIRACSGNSEFVYHLLRSWRKSIPLQPALLPSLRDCIFRQIERHQKVIFVDCLDCLNPAILFQHEAAVSWYILNHFCAGPVYQLRCGHVYHTECLKKWFEQRASCPLCLKEFGKVDPCQKWDRCLCRCMTTHHSGCTVRTLLLQDSSMCIIASMQSATQTRLTSGYTTYEDWNNMEEPTVSLDVLLFRLAGALTDIEHILPVLYWKGLRMANMAVRCW